MKPQKDMEKGKNMQLSNAKAISNLATKPEQRK